MSEAKFLGMPIRTSKPLDMMLARILGRLLHRENGIAFYQYKGDVYVLEDSPPPNHRGR